MELQNRRGIFITSVISKIFEKTRMEKAEALTEEVSKYQCGGIKGKSTVDHLLTTTYGLVMHASVLINCV